MLELKQIVKDYEAGGETVHALKGLDLRFRTSEFVSILGPSGCGKTTLLNIIGGLDQYTSGDLVIDGVSTKDYKDRDWDTYRNHSIGFVFQTYNLIPHQTVLKNVELALTLAGIPKNERKTRAIEALNLVGLGDKINKRPNQLSGGQMQRVAIARALVNNPDIILADEPTGALDTETGIQVMELLKDVAKDRLVVMVTHNPELAEKYSSRIIRILDGVIVEDSDPLSEEEYAAEKQAEIARAEEENDGNQAAANKTKSKKKRKKQSLMSVWTAFKLSLNNLLSKIRRTAMVSVAGSIGIIGVSMVLAISAGVQNYITVMENDMLSGNPVAITQSAYDFTSLMSLSVTNTKVDVDKVAKGDKVYVRSLLDTLGTFAKGFERTNTITEAYVHYLSKIPEDSVNVVQFGYAFNVNNNIYTNFTVSNNLNSHFKEGDSWDYNGGKMSIAAIRAMYSNILSHVEEYKQWGSMISTVDTFSEVPNNFDYVMSQYDVLAVDYNGQAVTSGYSEDYLKSLFNDKSTLIMVVQDQYFSDLMFAQFGYFTEDEFLDYAFAGINNEEEAKGELVGANGIPYSNLVGDAAENFKFTYYPNDSVYSKQKFQVKYLSDEQVGALIAMILGSDGAAFAPMLTNEILAARNESDDKLKEVLAKYQMDMLFDTLRKPATPYTEGFVANAYTTEYTVKQDGMDDIVLPAFGTDVGEVELGVKLILQKKDSVSYGCLDTGLYYTNALTEYILETEAESEIVKYIQTNGALDEVPCYVDYYYVEDTDDGSYYVLETAQGSIDTGASMMSTIIGSISGAAPTSVSAAMLGGSRIPTAVYFYPVDFERKDVVTDYLDAWNDMCEKGSVYTYVDFDGNEATVTLEAKDQITYTDAVGLIIAMINTMIEMITIALVAFTALSLVVSTVMIGIITYVSVVERVKEIGILRAIGARKKDIKRLFNAETFIMGLAAGVVGIAVTYLLSLTLNLILGFTVGIYTIAALPFWQALIMVGISVGLTLISGLIPARGAAKKNPVVALRTE
ncbi:MAG: ABC transporter ATP-binding protein/permease [Clostridiales bacterium]|nr:ABC transporter ATP-binding protein/permease [Clostridiales bacterium]